MTVTEHFDRWTSRLGAFGQIPFESNPYNYVAGNPLRWIDRFGFELVSPQEGQQIANEASRWRGTPYAPRDNARAGAGAEKGLGADCSGAVWGIYNAAGFPYTYDESPKFPGNPRFKKSPGNKPQVGDVGWWNGHMVIYDPNPSKTCECKPENSNSDAWTARNLDHPYNAAPQGWYSKTYGPAQWYRYDKP